MAPPGGQQDQQGAADLDQVQPAQQGRPAALPHRAHAVRELGLPIFKLEQWRRKADAALERALKGPGHCPGPKRTRVPASLLRPCSGSAS